MALEIVEEGGPVGFEAVRLEIPRGNEKLEPNLLAWVGQELYSTEGGAVRRQLVSSHAGFQNVVLSLATTKASGEASRVAGSVLLHFKGVQGEEEAYLTDAVEKGFA